MLVRGALARAAGSLRCGLGRTGQGRWFNCDLSTLQRQSSPAICIASSVTDDFDNPNEWVRIFHVMESICSDLSAPGVVGQPCQS